MSEQSAGATVTALGMFDGVHAGHQRILARTVAKASEEGCQAAVFTFLEHPARVLNPERPPAQLTGAVERARLFRALGIERVEMMAFDTAFSRQTPEQFVTRIVVGMMRARAVVVGYNYHFGHRRAGTPDVLRVLGRVHGFEVEIVDPVIADGEPISSSRIRALIETGAVEKAARLLGRPVKVCGVVMPGAGLAAKIGYPTANVYLDDGTVAPGDGIYAIRVPAGVIGEQACDGIAYHGRRPTRHAGAAPIEASLLQRILEVHVFDWRGSLEGRRLEVELHAKLRDDQVFPSEAELVAQIQRDMKHAREVLAAAR